MQTRKYLEGNCSDGYTFFSYHKKDKGYIFRLLANNAEKVYICGDFNDYKKEELRKYQTGVFSISENLAKENDSYYYLIEDKNGEVRKKIDPYSKKIDLKNNLTIIEDYDYKFSYKKPKYDYLNTYEINLQYYLESEDESLSTLEKYKKLISHVKENNFNYIQLMPINAYLDKDSLGYRSINLFSLDEKISSLLEFKKFIDLCHKEKIGVILDFDISEFDPINCGLVEFDGSRVFESDYEDIRYNYFSGMNFDSSKNLVKSYILSAIEFWIKEFNLDLIRFSNVEKLIYWQGDLSRGENSNWCEFIKIINEKIHSLKIKSIASMNISKDIIRDDLGFDYIYSNDLRKIIKVFQKHPFYRNNYKKDITNLITKDYKGKILGFNYLDSYIEGCTPAMKMYSDDYKYEQYKSLICLLYTIKSEKSLFYGNEVGELEKWDLKNIKEIKLDDKKKDFSNFFKELTNLYISNKAFNDKNSKIYNLDIEGNSIYAFKRVYKNEEFLIILNLTDIDYELKLEHSYKIILSTKNIENKKVSKIEKIKLDKFQSVILKK